MKNPTLSVIILNYNTRQLTIACLKSVIACRNELDFEIIIVDNGSTDDSLDEIRKLDFKGVKNTIIENSQNLGFAKGNNTARGTVKGKYVLFLNTDTLVNPGVFIETVDYLEEHNDVGVVTCKLVLANGTIDPDSRRAFPTPWVALTHFSGLDRLFPKSPILSKYWYGHISPEIVIDIDVAQGAFFLTRKKILDDVGWFDEIYFLDGEDIDLSWKIKQKGLKIVYYPRVWIRHFKKQTKKLNKAFVGRGVDSMAIFYKKWLWSRYPFFVNWLVMIGIHLIKLMRSVFK
ncbi:MAG: glycosyltransferase family 2 protein [Patescibacteria group bacterium]